MKIIDKVIYTAVFLTPESQQKLLEQFPAIHTKVFAHHSTIEFRPQNADIPLGEQYPLKVVGYIADEKAQAIIVENNYSKKQHPHITISTREDTAPVYVDEMILGGEIIPVNDFVLDRIVGYFNGTDDVIK